MVLLGIAACCFVLIGDRSCSFEHAIEEPRQVTAVHFVAAAHDTLCTPVVQEINVENGVWVTVELMLCPGLC